MSSLLPNTRIPEMTYKFRYSFVFFFVSALSVHAQYERFLHKDYQGRAKEWGNFWTAKTVNAAYDSTIFFREILAIRDLAVRHRDEGLEMDTYMGELSFFLYRKKYSDQTALAALNRTLKIARKKRLLQEASVEKHFGVMYFYRIKNFELAFEHFLRMYELVKHVSKREFPDKTNCLKELASAYYYFDDFPKTIELAKASIQSELEAGEGAHLGRNYGLVGICFRKLNQLDSSDYYFNTALQAATSQHDTLWTGINYGELGFNAYLRNQFGQATPLLTRALRIVKPREEFSSTARILTALGAMALVNGKDAEAQELLLEAKAYADSQKELGLYELLYPWLLKLYVRLNRPQLVMMYSDSTVWVKDSLQRQFSTRKLLRAIQANQLRQHRAEMTDIETQKKMKRNGIFALLVIGFGLALYIYYNQRKKYLQNQWITAQQLQLKEQELSLSTQQLKHFAKSISEKNTLIEKLQQKPENSDTYRVIEQLQNATILTDEQWEHFRQLFEKVHTGYLYRVKEKIPGLTPAEVRLMALVKLQFSTKEMAAVLGISPNSVRSTWSRLRKKLNLPEEGTMEELLEIIG
jgi:hypothetical protein